MVQAWAGKWHIFEAELPAAPAEPINTHNRVAKPERPQALTTCGEEIMVKKRRDIAHVNVAARELCDRCRPVVTSRQM
jgi:hypothetical protein